MDWFLYDVGLHHERVKVNFKKKQNLYTDAMAPLFFTFNPLMPGDNKKVTHT